MVWCLDTQAAAPSSNKLELACAEACPVLIRSGPLTVARAGGGHKLSKVSGEAEGREHTGTWHRSPKGPIFRESSWPMAPGSDC